MANTCENFDLFNVLITSEICLNTSNNYVFKNFFHSKNSTQYFNFVCNFWSIFANFVVSNEIMWNVISTRLLTINLDPLIGFQHRHNSDILHAFVNEILLALITRNLMEFLSDSLQDSAKLATLYLQIY